MTGEMRRITLAARPNSASTDSSFAPENVPIPVPREGEVLVRVHYKDLCVRA
ncbi:MAG: hypothetical protein GDA36_12990 [Rhodobacteraceae bacterium]|nr:hypothetical protein [Paracoccaceae bacterium]